MELKLNVFEIEKFRIKDKSTYNNNYYKLPIAINDSNVLLGRSDDDNTTYWSLGDLVNGEFEVNLYLGVSYTDDGFDEYVDLSEANVEMIWT